ncbi:MAG TPA: sugar transferase [Deltaproteobacteria bacterium]|nr:sugar transferase [Deltaproteobacteria bacterium]
MKRVFDLLLSGLGLFVSLPLWVFFGILIKVQDGGPIFYGQERVGEKGRTFSVLKFRSMIVDAEGQTGVVWAVENDPRVTKIGRLLRATAMDELPQLWNIFKGDMSFVGPRAERPELVEQFARSIQGYRARLSVKPGLTGLAQVYGRYDTLPQHKLKFDRLYIKRQSLGLDLRLIMLSFLISFTGKWEHRGKRVGKRLPAQGSQVS